MPTPDKPLTQFLIALCHTPSLLAEFNSNPATVLAEWGLDDHPLFTAESAPTLTEVQAAVADEFPTEGAAAVTWWISVPDWVWGPTAQSKGYGGEEQ